MTPTPPPPPSPTPATAPGTPPGGGGPDLRRLFSSWVDTEVKAQLAMFYRENPGVVETVEGLARRLGIAVERLRKDLQGHIELGLLRERRLGDKTVLVYDRDRRSRLETQVQESLRSLGGAA